MVSVLVQRPCHMLAHERRFMVAARAQRSNGLRLRRRTVRYVAQAYRQVAQPALVADAVYRAAEQARVELLLAPGKELDERRCVEPVAHREVRLIAQLRVFVPRTDELAIVAAIDTVADQRPQRGRNAARVLD